MSEIAIAIIGVGYVGLPLAVGLANHHDDVIAFDGYLWGEDGGDLNAI